MKKIVLSIAVVLFSLVSMAQKAEFYQAMGEALPQYENLQKCSRFSGFGK